MTRMQPAPEGATTGLTRRQLLERSAVMGGAVLAAQSLGAVSAFAQTSAPPPPPPPPPPGAGLPSNFQLAVRVDGKVWGVKYDGGWDKIGQGGRCLTVAYDRTTPNSVINLFNGSVAAINGAYVLTVPTGVTVVQAATHDGTYDGNCSSPVSPNANGTYSFTKKPK